eukprot:CAMPEP_0202342542 /NCGR_PEP_ID=MMETSP1126-20121109/3063_1 /ASSEMBLY_ACC=CAM_ASM_000457 /TAXON_ID=3047 /ORGANISM="Dunaliella tertiolecta, Strain CCMP1320" /LENGTH=1296 /DNA_ID=CAMNT_0048933515 /DNA_START=311 /DNA_END=4201 /DNA_ORIENTATION=-
MLFLLLLVCATRAAAASNCTAASQQQALRNIFSAWDGSGWRKPENWLDSSLECEDPATGIQLPAHCCWHGIKCCISRTCSEGQRPDVDRCGCEPGLVWEIDLDSCNLAGDFSSMDHNAFACELSGLRLSNNNLRGPIGQGFTVYRKLSWIDLQGNYLSGTLPRGIGKMSSLWLLFLSGNSLEGTVPPDICGNNTQLFSLALDHNKFSGRLDLSACTKLSYFVAKANNFSEVFHAGNAALPGLRAVFLEENGLHRPLPFDIFINYLPNLEQLALHKNRLTGTLPVMSMYSLKIVVLADNYFVGPVPESWAIMARPGLLVAVEFNYLSCCGTNPLSPEKLLMANGTLRIDDVYDGVDYSAPLLPPSLELSDELEPVLAHPRQSYKAKGMRCPKLKLAGQQEGPLSTLDWYMDPSYYMFVKCQCEEGLHLVNLTKPGRLPYFECQALQLDTSDDRESWEEAYPWAIVIIVVVGCFLLITMLLGLYLYKGTEVVQKLNNLKKRMHGLPTSGPFTAVVTDIQGWTALCAQHPELSVKVLSIHNSILRKARWNNFGSTQEMEGDSFTMVFYDAKDAVAFCLQAQQMLSMQQWPSPKETSSEEQATSLMSSYVNPIGDLFLQNKSRSTHSTYSLLNPLSSSRFSSKHQSMNQATSVGIDIQVRMGLASGFLYPGESLHGHPTIELAREVSDAAAGGQILMEGSTFTAIKDVLGELGTVDAQGMHLDRLRMRRVFYWPACFLCRLFAPAPSANSEDAVVLDMGTYTKPRPDQEQAQAQPPPRMSFAGRSPRSFLLTSRLSLVGSMHKPANPNELRLYQVLPPSHAECAKVWGSRLRLRKELSLKDPLSKGYFEAPGTLAAPLGICKSPADASLPLVTTVFASVEQARVFSSKDMRQVERCLLACASKCLDQVQGDGYLCFSKPEAALAWSCGMQECMMLRSWPRNALKEPFREMHDQHGNLIFRGPRLKIGICEGRPDSIQPDHLGRADYHGDCVNSAARFMEGSAQGGMIVLEQELAVKAAEAWASMRSSSSNEQATETTLQKSRSCSALQPAHSSYGQLHHQMQQRHASEDGTPRKTSSLQENSSPPPQENVCPSPASAALTSPTDEDKLKAPASSKESPCSEPLYLLQPPQPLPVPTCTPEPVLREGSGSGNQHNLGSIHVLWLGSFHFKGISHTKSMVHILQDKLASRAAKFTPKSLNPIMATLMSQQQPKGPSKSTYLVSLPVIDAELASSPQEQGAKVTSVRFELESGQLDSGGRCMSKLSDTSGRGNLSGPQTQSQEPSQENASSPMSRGETLRHFL